MRIIVLGAGHVGRAIVEARYQEHEVTVIGRRAGEELSAFEAFGAAAACLGNVGPAFGFAGPYGSFAPFSDLSTWICTVLMWLGRVEIIPVAVVLTRAYWRS
jgi:trk system potassium uptake protein